VHIYEGFLAATPSGQAVLVAGATAAAVGTAIGLKKIDYERVPQIAVLSSAFFVASLIHVPIGPSSEHLVLCGLLGLVLGWAAFPAVFVALLLQAVFFSYGGLTTLGVNTLIMAVPAVVCHYLFRDAVRSRSESTVFVVGFAAGGIAILMGAFLAAGALWAAGAEFRMFSKLVVLGHLPIVVVEGLVTGSVVVLLRKVRPELLEAPLLATSQ